MNNDKKTKEIQELIFVLNIGGPSLFQYPIGNQELNEKTKAFEAKGFIQFNKLWNRWERGRARKP